MNTTIFRRRAAALVLAFATATVAPAGLAVAEGEVDAAAREQAYQELRQRIEAAQAEQATLPPVTGQLPLPEIFEGSVRGCTQDGKIYHVVYNMTVDMSDLAALADTGTTSDDRSLFDRSVIMDSERVQGVSGADGFVNALNDISTSLDHSMQTAVGPMIDNVTSGIIQGPEFMTILGNAAEQIGSEIGNRYGVDVTVITEAPRQQSAAPCGVATQPAPTPEPPTGMR